MQRKITRSVLFMWALLPLLPAWAQNDRAHQLAAQASSQAARQCGDVSTLADCHPAFPTGCTHSQHPRYDPYLNFLKNQQITRALAPARVLDINNLTDLEKHIPSGMLGRGAKHADFASQLAELPNGIGEGNIYGVVGFLYFVENTAVTSHHRGETCNCQLQGAGTFDFHLGIGFDSAVAQELRQNPPTHDPKNPGVAEKTSIVVEITPHTRDPKWTVSRLNRQRGKQVKVIGQLMLDSGHVKEADDCAFMEEDTDDSCWRASAWELHPVTQFFVCKVQNNCTASSPDSDWNRLEDMP
jgi:hypothetical protein